MGPLIVIFLLAAPLGVASFNTTDMDYPRINLMFRLQQKFTEQIANTSSEEFLTSASQVSTALNQLYEAEYEGFNRTVVNSFSHGSILAHVYLMFNQENATNASSAAAILVEAVSSETTLLSIDTMSISAMDSSSNDTGMFMIELGFQLGVTSTAGLTNNSSPEFEDLKSNITSQLNDIYSTAFGDAFNGTKVKSFRDGSIMADVDLLFDEGSSLPSASSAADTLEEAVSSGNFSLAIDISSISATDNTTTAENVTETQTMTTDNMTTAGNVTEMPTMPTDNMTTAGNVTEMPPMPSDNMTTAGNVTEMPPMPTDNMTTAGNVTEMPPMPSVMPPTMETPSVTATPPFEPKIALEFSLMETFTPALANTSSPEFKALELEITSALDAVYSAAFGDAFNRTVVNSFRAGSIVADVEVVFNEGRSLPNASSAADTLVEASSSGNFSLNVNTSSISASVVEPPTPPTATPDNFTTAGNGTEMPPMPTGNQPTEESAPTPEVTPELTFNLVFSLVQDFSPELANNTSPEFQALASNVTAVLDDVYSLKFGSNFLMSEVNSFSAGSVVVDAELRFANASSGPNATDVVNTLADAASSDNFSLPVNTSTIAAAVLIESTPTSSPMNVTGAPDNTSNPTADQTNSTPQNTAEITTSETAAVPSTTAPTAPPTATPTVTQGPSTAPSTAVTTTATLAPTDPPSDTEGTLSVTFSLDRTFTPDLNDPTSEGFQSLSALVRRQLNAACRRAFGSSFRRSIIDRFRSGSVIVDATVVFADRNSVPSVGDASSSLCSEIDSSSLGASDCSVSAPPGSTNGAPRPTTVSLTALLSLTALGLTHLVMDC